MALITRRSMPSRLTPLSLSSFAYRIVWCFSRLADGARPAPVLPLRCSVVPVPCAAASALSQKEKQERNLELQAHTLRAASASIKGFEAAKKAARQAALDGEDAKATMNFREFRVWFLYQ